ncbi:MAG TPA: DNA-3-methyladenine glycosylase [Polyangiaceae bacterium]|nr:DNA-3-methyladenine glycosylase [Polyangiaceae bacterium]
MGSVKSKKTPAKKAARRAKPPGRVQVNASEPPSATSSRSPAPGGYGFDPEHALSHLREADAVLGALIDAVGPFGLELKHTQSVFQALAEAIVHQQLTGKAAQTIWSRVVALYPRSPEGPTPALVKRTDPEKLRGAGLSRAKVLALKDLAEKALSGDIPTLDVAHAMEDDAVVEQLTAVRGIGRWTVQMFLMFRLGRGDVLPVDDYGVKNGYRLAYKKRALPDKKALTKHGERWAPYRSVASWYLWRAVDLAKRKD